MTSRRWERFRRVRDILVRPSSVPTLLARCLMLSFLCASVWGQTASPPQPKETPTDTLRRGTPYSSAVNFTSAADSRNYDLAARYLQIRRQNPTAEDRALAQQLETILEHQLGEEIARLSDEEPGNLEDGLPPDRELLGTARTGEYSLDVQLVRVEDPKAGPVWLFSTETLRQVPRYFDQLPFSKFEQKLPPSLVKTEFLRMRLWQWLAVMAACLVAVVLGWLTLAFLRAITAIIRRFRKGGKSSALAQPFSGGPALLIASLLWHYLLARNIGIPVLYSLYYRKLVVILIAVGAYWALFRIIDSTSNRIRIRMLRSGESSALSLLPLVRRIVKIFVSIVFALAIVGSFGVDITTFVAGLGVGGLALGFGAQKTIENLFGGVSVLSDKAIHVGDFCSIAGRLGTVEDIGLRSTRIRTLDRTIVAVPNGVVSNENIENYTYRDKIFFRHVVGLRYETSADQLRYVLIELRKVLREDVRVEDATARVRLLRFASSSFDIEVFAYVLTTDYATFLETQEDLLLKIIETVDESGTGFAFPSQTTYLGRDSGLDPEKTSAAIAKVFEWRREDEEAKQTIPKVAEPAVSVVGRESTSTPPAGGQTRFWKRYPSRRSSSK